MTFDGIPTRTARNRLHTAQHRRRLLVRPVVGYGRGHGVRGVRPEYGAPDPTAAVRAVHRASTGLQ